MSNEVREYFFISFLIIFYSAIPEVINEEAEEKKRINDIKKKR